MKEYNFGNAKVVVHSSILSKTKEEQEAMLIAERKKGNPDLERLTDLVNECYRKFCKDEP